MQLRYWTDFRGYIESQKTSLRPQKAAACHWLNFAIGTSVAHTYAFVDTVSHRIGVRLQLKGGPGRLPLYRHIEEQKEVIEGKLGFEQIWEEKPEKQSSYLTVYNTDFDPEHTETWEQQFEWLRGVLEKLREHVAPRIKAFSNRERG